MRYFLDRLDGFFKVLQGLHGAWTGLAQGSRGAAARHLHVAPLVVHADADEAAHEQLRARLLGLGGVVLHGRARAVLRLRRVVRQKLC